ncbi:hypothetical protein EYC84_000617 [Monilinia fructicola]|uniref:Uncharacterized protein n=1 Tax=Monilinia fructicola TaxID=38448 RepID=A0A5M9JP70_MONFR|nr:hypothetical protein EYC84_000617 [Monilinia fructicola]
MPNKAGNVINPPDLRHAQDGLKDLIAQVMNASMLFWGKSINIINNNISTLILLLIYHGIPFPSNLLPSISHSSSSSFYVMILVCAVWQCFLNMPILPCHIVPGHIVRIINYDSDPIPS